MGNTKYGPSSSLTLMTSIYHDVPRAVPFSFFFRSFPLALFTRPCISALSRRGFSVEVEVPVAVVCVDVGVGG